MANKSTADKPKYNQSDARYQVAIYLELVKKARLDDIARFIDNRFSGLEHDKITTASAVLKSMNANNFRATGGMVEICGHYTVKHPNSRGASKRGTYQLTKFGLDWIGIEYERRIKNSPVSRFATKAKTPSIGKIEIAPIKNTGNYRPRVTAKTHPHLFKLIGVAA